MAIQGLSHGLDISRSILIIFHRFFIHKSIATFAEAIVAQHGSSNEQALLLPSHNVAMRCLDFFQKQIPRQVRVPTLRVLDFMPIDGNRAGVDGKTLPSAIPNVSAVIFPQCYSHIGKTFWQHTGDGISSRRAEICHQALDDGHLIARCASQVHEDVQDNHPHLQKGPRRYQKTSIKASLDTERTTSWTSSSDDTALASGRGLEGRDYVQFIEERFGRNLDGSLAANAKLAIRRRIAGALTKNVELSEALEQPQAVGRARQVPGFSESDVYLFPSGMSAISNTHRMLMACRGQLKSISFGFVGPNPNVMTVAEIEYLGFHILIRSRSWKNGGLGACFTDTAQPPIWMLWSSLARVARNSLRSFANSLGTHC